MNTFKQYLEENRLVAAAAALAIGGSSMALPPKPEALERMVQRMKEKEGFRPIAEPDKDATGHPIVVGYGTTHKYPDTGNSIQSGETVTKDRAEELVRSSFKAMTPHMEKIPHWDTMNPGQQSSLLSFGYNVGPGFYGKKGFETISTALKNKDWNSVPKAMALYNKAGGKVFRGLVTRRAEEGAMWNETQTASAQPSTSITTDTSKPYTVIKGDNLAKIAKQHKTTVNDIQKLNPDIKDPNKIDIGQRLRTK